MPRSVLCLLLALAFLAAAVPAAGAGRTVEGPNYTLYVPSGLEPGQLRPMVMVFAPDGNPAALVALWRPHAERYRWFVLGFRDYRNTNDITPILESLRKLLGELEASYPINPKALIATGFSGGGMFSHSLSALIPDQVVAVVANTGMSQPDLRSRTPRGRLAVFLASPKDFRYKEMQEDAKRLQGLGWETKWIEFSGGHAVAPAACYKQAADWLAGMLNWVTSRPAR